MTRSTEKLAGTNFPGRSRAHASQRRLGTWLTSLLFVLFLGSPTLPLCAQETAPAESPDNQKESTETLKQELERSRKIIEELTRRVEALERGGGQSGKAGAAAGNADLAALRQELERSRQLLAELSERLQTLEEDASAQDSRLEELEGQVTQVDERIGRRTVVRAFDGIKLDVGGFLTQGFLAGIGDDSSEFSFNQTLFELLIRADTNQDWSFFTALGFLREADLDFSDPAAPFFRPSANRIPQILAWVNYRAKDSFQVQAGRFVTPHGIINIEHFPPILLDLNQPQFLRPFSGNTIFPNFLNGLQLHGRIFTGPQGRHTLQYNLYSGLFVGGDASDFLFGARTGYSFGESGLTVGTNYGHGRRTAAVSPLGSVSIVGESSLTSNSYDMAGFDFLVDKGRFLWKNEAFYSFETGFPDRLAFYTQPALRLSDRWIVFYRFDYLDPGQDIPIGREHGIGINYTPSHLVRIRAAYWQKLFGGLAPDAGVFQLNATVSF